MGGGRLGPGNCIAHLRGDLVFYRKTTGARIVFCIACIFAFWWVDRCCDHIYGNTQHAGTGTGPDSLLIVVAQIITAYVIELFGLFGQRKMPFAWHKLLGAAVAVAGIFIFER